MSDPLRHTNTERGSVFLKLFSTHLHSPAAQQMNMAVVLSLFFSLLCFTGVKSPYVVYPPQPALEKSHSNAMKNLGVSMIMSNVIRRQLSHIDISKSKVKNPNPFPPRPSPSIPTFALPPLVGTIPPQPNYHVPAPYIAPMASPPYGTHLPAFDPARLVGVVPAPLPPHVRLAKPSVPAETLQEVLDYACGEGDVNCDAIKEDGNCYYPDLVVAHASYAFNSYWQKTKANGGTCGFGGTAMIITSDLSNHLNPVMVTADSPLPSEVEIELRVSSVLELQTFGDNFCSI
ncbi:hypothetical protein SASPL_156494 [Salvia splendens]|uniref:X8 domain-containing protein n=1 Tax=Salvia splendens TaxID=180675 RepID=A0A8X8VWM6_SALSN|nr:hypothetical protein SASPL_156494 [Salvia splendens]